MNFVVKISDQVIDVTLACDDSHWTKALKTGKMKMGMRDILLCEIDIIIQQQICISNYISVLEDRRQRLIEFIQTSEELEMSKHAHENIIDNVVNMEIKLVTQKDCQAKNQRVREKRKCRYDNRGYCKHLNNST